METEIAPLAVTVCRSLAWPCYPALSPCLLYHEKRPYPKAGAKLSRNVMVVASVYPTRFTRIFLLHRQHITHVAPRAFLWLRRHRQQSSTRLQNIAPEVHGLIEYHIIVATLRRPRPIRQSKHRTPDLSQGVCALDAHVSVCRSTLPPPHPHDHFPRRTLVHSPDLRLGAHRITAP